MQITFDKSLWNGKQGAKKGAGKPAPQSIGRFDVTADRDLLKSAAKPHSGS